MMRKQREIKETIPFTIAVKIATYLGIHLPKERKGLFIESYKTLIKETLCARGPRDPTETETELCLSISY